MDSHMGIPGLEHVVLEESWVLQVTIMPYELHIDVEFVVDREHPQYREAAEGDVYWPLKGVICFGGMKEIHWVAGGPAAVSADPEVDYGNIEFFARQGDMWVLEGDFGRIDIKSDPPVVTTEGSSPGTDGRPA